MRRSSFLRGEPLAPGTLPDISWFDAAGEPVDWSGEELSLTCLLAAPPTSNVDERPRHILLLIHAGTLPCEFAIPAPARKIRWNLFINTAAESPADIHPNLDGPDLRVDRKVTLIDHTLVCYVSAP